MQSIIVILACLVGIALAAPYPSWLWPGFPYGGPAGYPAPAGYKSGYYPHNYPGHYDGYGDDSYSHKWIFYGQYPGDCSTAADGLYYVDANTFAYCSNGNKYVQPCAEGSANPPLNHYHHGGYYGFYDFCAVNLVAQGYHAGPVAPPAPPKLPALPAPPAYPQHKSDGYAAVNVQKEKVTYEKQKKY